MYLKKYQYIIFFTLFVLVLTACSKPEESESPSKTKETKYLGAALPLTGDGAAYGQYAKMAIDLAIDELNSNPQRKEKIEIIYEDTKLDPKETVNAVTKLITINKVPAIIGPMASSSVRAAMPLATKNKVVIISPSATDHELSKAGKYFFRTVISDIYEGEVMGKFAYNTMHYKRIGILYIESSGPFGMAKAFEKFFTEAGGKITLIEKGLQNTTDLRAQLTKLKTADIDAIFFAGFAAETATMLKQSKELGVQKQILSHQPAEAPEVRERAGDAASGVIFATYTTDAEDLPQSAKDFNIKFKTKYDKEPQNFAANSYDAVMVLVTAIEKYGYDSESIINGLYSIDNFQGATGTISFDKNGDITQPLHIMTIKNNNVVPYQHY